MGASDPVHGIRTRGPPRDLHHAIEALNRQLRKAVKTKAHFPTEDTARKLIYLAIQNAVPQWTRTRGWTKPLLAFKSSSETAYPTNRLPSLLDTLPVCSVSTVVDFADVCARSLTLTAHMLL
jgi:Transposase, Mutator family